MPRKMRAGKARRQTGWELENLDQLIDVLALHSGCIRGNSVYPRVRIRTLEDAKAAWKANRNLFMRMCQCQHQQPRCSDHALRYSPGERPWAWWYFDMGYPGIPEDETAELERLGLLSEAEKRALQHKPDSAEILKFNK